MILPDYIASKLDHPFKYGTHDCVLFTIGWVEIATGKKYLPSKLWYNEKSALKLLSENGGMESVFDKYFEKIQPNYAQDGNLTVVDGIAYLFSGSGIVSVGHDGLMFKDRTISMKAWK